MSLSAFDLGARARMIQKAKRESSILLEYATGELREFNDMQVGDVVRPWSPFTQGPMDGWRRIDTLPVPQAGPAKAVCMTTPVEGCRP